MASTDQADIAKESEAIELSNMKASSVSQKQSDSIDTEDNLSNASPVLSFTATNPIDELIDERISASPRQTSNSMFNEMKTNNWCRFFKNLLFWIRILLLTLMIFFFFLSLSYCIAQLLEPKLDLITECPKPKSIEEIWQHSYQSTFKYSNDSILNEESMYVERFNYFFSIQIKR